MPLNWFQPLSAVAFSRASLRLDRMLGKEKAQARGCGAVRTGRRLGSSWATYEPQRASSELPFKPWLLSGFCLDR
jgi:hypothetical protein